MTEIRYVKSQLKTKTFLQVASSLGYESPGTVVSWIKNNRVSPVGKRRIAKKLKGKKWAA